MKNTNTTITAKTAAAIKHGYSVSNANYLAKMPEMPAADTVPAVPAADLPTYTPTAPTVLKYGEIVKLSEKVIGAPTVKEYADIPTYTVSYTRPVTKVDKQTKEKTEIIKTSNYIVVGDGEKAYILTAVLIALIASKTKRRELNTDSTNAPVKWFERVRLLGECYGKLANKYEMLDNATITDCLDTLNSGDGVSYELYSVAITALLKYSITGRGVYRAYSAIGNYLGTETKDFENVAGSYNDSEFDAADITALVRYSNEYYNDGLTPTENAVLAIEIDRTLNKLGTTKNGTKHADIIRKYAEIKDITAQNGGGSSADKENGGGMRKVVDYFNQNLPENSPRRIALGTVQRSIAKARAAFNAYLPAPEITDKWLYRITKKGGRKVSEYNHTRLAARGITENAIRYNNAPAVHCNGILWENGIVPKNAPFYSMFNMWDLSIYANKYPYSFSELKWNDFQIWNRDSNS